MAAPLHWGISSASRVFKEAYKRSTNGPKECFNLCGLGTLEAN